MEVIRTTVHMGDLGYVVYIGPEGETGAFAATLGAVIRQDGGSVRVPVLAGNYIGDSPGQALDAILSAALRVYGAS
jgi:hypothetical protein